MDKKLFKPLTGTLCTFFALLVAQPASAITVTFYDDLTLFMAATTTTLIDFEGIVDDDEVTTSLGSMEVGGVTFSVEPSNLSVGIAGKDSALAGNPFDSALLFSLNNVPITADLTTAGSGFTAIGGFFGTTRSETVGAITTMTLTGTSGVLDSRDLAVADMGFDTPSNFFGWTVSGDTIESLSHGFTGNTEGIDDFRYGTVIPVPAAVWLFGSGLIGLIAIARRQS